MTHGGPVQIQETDEHVADNPRADRAEAIAATSDIGFAQHVFGTFLIFSGFLESVERWLVLFDVPIR